MRRSVPLLVLALVLAGSGFVSRHDGEPLPAPRFANITAACTPSNNAQVRPARVLMQRQDSVIWREPSGRATQWVITPKDPENWLFDQASFTGTQQQPAITRRPRANALPNHAYAYNVRITCADGTVQIIDPDIVIGDAEER